MSGGCTTCAGHIGRLTHAKEDVRRLARRCARDETPRNLALLAKAIEKRDVEAAIDRYCARCEGPQTPTALPPSVRNTIKENQ